MKPQEGMVVSYQNVPPAAPLAPAPYGYAAPYGDAPRPWWRTWLISSLLTLIPIVGAGMAIVYVHTRKRPSDYDAGEAAVSALVYVGCILLSYAVIFLVFALLTGMFTGGR